MHPFIHDHPWRVRLCIVLEEVDFAMVKALYVFDGTDEQVLGSGGACRIEAFGNGGSAVDPTGVITYLPPNTTGQNASLYNETYSKVVDDNSASNTDPANNYLTVVHTSGAVYTDIITTCLLDYGEPAGQQAFDNSTNFNGEYVFDELGLQCWNGSASNLLLITHVIFHPVQKSLNRQIQIDYTLRIQTLTNLSAA
jgi:hypothetical protein